MRLNDARRMDHCQKGEYGCDFPECSCSLSYEREEPPVQKSTNHNAVRILGLRLSVGIPLIEMLCTNYIVNTKTPIEVAREYYNVEPNKYNAILFVWDTRMIIFTQDQLK